MSPGLSQGLQRAVEIQPSHSREHLAAKPLLQWLFSLRSNGQGLCKPLCVLEGKQHADAQGEMAEFFLKNPSFRIHGFIPKPLLQHVPCQSSIHQTPSSQVNSNTQVQISCKEGLLRPERYTSILSLKSQVWSIDVTLKIKQPSHAPDCCHSLQQAYVMLSGLYCFSFSDTSTPFFFR